MVNIGAGRKGGSYLKHGTTIQGSLIMLYYPDD